MEMPGLRLKREQVQRLCGVERTVCQRALDLLVDERVLCLKADGAYARLTDGESARRRPAKADLPVDRTSAKAS
jgi:DNA-binding GntR family transcriptional regulator